MNVLNTALILVGYQNDYFGKQGVLHQVVEESSRVNNVITNTVDLIDNLPDGVLIVSTPITFTCTYEELLEPVGILKNIKEAGALQAGTKGVEAIEELSPFKSRIVEVSGRRGFNAFAYTDLHLRLQEKKITNVVIAGAITSICIDSTGRHAHELGYRVSILSDCTAARTVFEQEFYCENIFPVYAEVITYKQLLDSFKVAL
jgi:nicotinamidase-related amidase